MATQTSVTVEPLAGPYELGEGPHWDQRTQKLYFVDIFKKKIYRFDPATGSTSSVVVENGPVGVAVPVDGTPDKLVAGSGTDFILLSWDGENDVTKCLGQTLTKVDVDRSETRWNDGKVDSSGRFWGGTMSLEKDGQFPPDKGSLYCIGSDLVPKKEISPVGISNGLAWSIKDDIFYYIDSLLYQVLSFDYNPQTGAISNKKVLFDLKKNNISGLPDGMTIDTDGNLWVALYGGGSVIQINPGTGKLLRSIKIPAKNITSVAFGGPEYDVLYVTSASIGLSKKELESQPNAGYLFAVKGLGVRGFPPNLFKLNA